MVHSIAEQCAPLGVKINVRPMPLESDSAFIEVLATRRSITHYAGHGKGGCHTGSSSQGRAKLSDFGSEIAWKNTQPRTSLTQKPCTTLVLGCSRKANRK